MAYKEDYTPPRIRLNSTEYELIMSLRGNEAHVRQYLNRNVLCIGDLHEPFCLDEYLEFNENLANKHHITDVVFLGDVIDAHFSSFHETDPDGMGGGDELDLAIKRIKRWYKAIPNAKVLLGNPDRIIMRKAFSGGIPKRWIKDYKDVLEVPNWDFVESYELDGVLYVHGDGGGRAISRARKNMESTVCGHWHTDSYVQYIVGSKFKIFGMQVGCGIDRKSYAQAYAKNHPKPAIGSGVILDNGRLPFTEMMSL